MNRAYAYKLCFVIGTTALAGLLSWLTGLRFGVAWYSVAVITADAVLVRNEANRRRAHAIARLRPL
jgi:hypothetical protein